MQYDAVKVDMGEWDDINSATTIYTEGLAPCIGLCIAWKGWAGIAHGGDLTPCDDLFKELVAKAKASIPPERFVHIRPILCGHSIDPPEEVDAAEYEAEMLQARRDLVNALLAEGFDMPRERWSEKGQGAEVYADLEAGKVWVMIDYTETTWDVQK